MKSALHAPQFTPVLELLQRYFDGLYHGDAEALARVFHPQASYASATEGALVHLDMARYLPIVARRPSPASRDETRADEVLSIDFIGPTAALAKVRCRIGPKHFTDLLSLVRIDQRWQIIAKVFDFHLDTHEH